MKEIQSEYKKIETGELKKIQLEILNIVADFCEKNKINYWLDSGTLIGAIRHKGYIPWDDDIDIGMLRTDFDKFMQTFNLNNDRYKFYCYENNKNFPYPYGKVLDTNTVLYEPDKKGNKLSVNIDVFVYDNAPDDDKKMYHMYRKRDIYRICNIFKLPHKPSGNKIKKIIFYLLKIMLKPLPRNYFVNKLIENSKTYSDIKTKRVGNFMWMIRIAADKEIFSEFIDAEFEGKKYKIPIGYDKWLRMFYGDYMKLPPKEERKSHHKFEAYYKE